MNTIVGVVIFVLFPLGVIYVVVSTFMKLKRMAELDVTLRDYVENDMVKDVNITALQKENKSLRRLLNDSRRVNDISND